MLKKSLSQGCWHVLAPFFVVLACQGKVDILNALKQKADSGCRQPRCIRRDTRYCGNLVWVVPAEGSGTDLSNFPAVCSARPQSSVNEDCGLFNVFGWYVMEIENF